MLGNEGVNFIFFAGFALLNQKALFWPFKKCMSPFHGWAACWRALISFRAPFSGYL
jgi:hypothetical protein